MPQPPSPTGDSGRPGPGGLVPADEEALAPARRIRTSRRVSWLLDECIRIPGTNVRFGLDPILGLFPYGGEAVSTLSGAVILGDAGKKGLPLRTLVRMGGNMVLNAGVGAIPAIGDVFSVWFKSNTRNYRMLNTYLESDHGAEERGGWWPALVIVGVLGVVVVLNLAAWVLLTAGLVWLTHRMG